MSSAGRGSGIKGVQPRVRFVDLDKCLPPTPLDAKASKELAAKAAPALEAVGAGTATRAQEATSREAIRDILKSHGVATRDDRRKGGVRDFGFSVDRPQGMDRLAGKDPGAGSLAVHGWDGAVTVRPGEATDAAAAFKDLAKDPSAFKNMLGKEATEQLRGVATLVHEELHGASNARQTAYAFHGVAMEEAATEILARKMTRELAGQKLTLGNADIVAFPLPVRLPAPAPNAMQPQANPLTYGSNPRVRQAYDDYIERLFTHTAEVSGHEKIHERIEEALLKTRAWDGAVTNRKVNPEGIGWGTGTNQCEAYARALGLDPADQKKLVDRLIADPGFR